MKGYIRWDKEGNTHYFAGDEEVTEERFIELFPPAPSPGQRAGESLVGWKRPLKSDGAAVHPSQVKEAMEDAQAKGVPTHFNKDGRPEWRDRDHRKRYMKAYGFFDKDGGYGDAQQGGTRGRDKQPENFDLGHLEEANSERGVTRRG